MLVHLSIHNYALIDTLDIAFPGGLTIITGETGAGKSILLGALSLILGERADTQALQDKTKKCTVEGTFDIKGYGLKELFATHELDYEEKTSIRREIIPTGVGNEGKSRAFVNDTPVTLTVLKELGEKLIDIHSQHETLSLNDAAFQLSVTDAYTGHLELLGQYKDEYRGYKKAQQQLNELLEAEAQSKKDQDYFQFQFNELEEAGLEQINQKEMEQELEMLNNAEGIKSGLAKAEGTLDGGEVNLIQSLNEVKALIASFSKFNPAIAQLSDRINSSYIELKDIASELSSIQGSIHFDAKRIEDLNAKLDALYRLQQKHRVDEVAELIALRNELSDKLLNISTLEGKINAIQSEITKQEKSLLNKAGKLTKGRGDAAPKIEKEISKALSSLGMPDGKMEVKLEKLEVLSPTGTDKIVFLFSANKGSAAKELNKVASGGELSRLMLSIKALIAKLTRLPSIIFDEIDTGVSGDVADKVGSIMDSMGKSMQVIVITHLPQIASKGQSHLFVYKEVKGGKTYTQIRTLDKTERVKEIAKMLSTENPTEAAIKNAKELLRSN